jgi:uncharacterized protein
MSKSIADTALPWALDWAPAERGIKLVFYGGEPTLAWPLITAVVPEWRAAFGEIGVPIEFSITTNGTLLTPERRAWMDENKVGMLLSLDGPKWCHDESRPAKVGSSWDQINPPSLLKWRPELEIAWALAPGAPWGPKALDELIHLGFRKVAFNLAFDADWSVEESARLQAFGKHVGRLAALGQVSTNWTKKYNLAGTGDRMPAPCGTNPTGMLALTPEGDLFPSQEMAFAVYGEGKPANTPAWYRVGNVRNTPVIDPMADARVRILKTSDMKPSEGYDCNDCVATAACIGGCHCRYVGQNGDAAARTDIPPGHCASMRAFLTGFIMGHWIERKLTPPEPKGHAATGGACPTRPRPKPATIEGDVSFPEVANLSFRR